MAVYVDLECSQCGALSYDQWSSLIDSKCECGGRLDWLPSVTRGPDPMPPSDDRCVVYWSEKEKQYQYPGRNDVPVPARLQQRGYERVEMNPRQIAAFERRHNVVNERRHYDRNGRSYDGADGG